MLGAQCSARRATVTDRNKDDRIIPDWLGWLALAVAGLLGALVLYFKLG
jgi:hypothetical protein